MEVILLDRRVKLTSETLSTLQMDTLWPKIDTPGRHEPLLEAPRPCIYRLLPRFVSHPRACAEFCGLSRETLAR